MTCRQNSPRNPARGPARSDDRLIHESANRAAKNRAPASSSLPGNAPPCAAPQPVHRCGAPSPPVSFGGQHQNRGYWLVDELELMENARRIGEKAVGRDKAEGG